MNNIIIHFKNPFFASYFPWRWTLTCGFTYIAAKLENLYGDPNHLVPHMNRVAGFRNAAVKYFIFDEHVQFCYTGRESDGRVTTQSCLNFTLSEIFSAFSLIYCLQLDLKDLL